MSKLNKLVRLALKSTSEGEAVAALLQARKLGGELEVETRTVVQRVPVQDTRNFNLMQHMYHAEVAHKLNLLAEVQNLRRRVKTEQDTATRYRLQAGVFFWLTCGLTLAIMALLVTGAMQ